MAESSGGFRLAAENREIRGSEMYELLDRACAKRVLVQVIINSDDPPAVTRIASVQLQHMRRIDLYAFGVGEMDRRMEPGASLDITMMVDNLPYHFRSRCLGGGIGIRHHGIEIPSMATAIQRRAYFRVQLPNSNSMTARIRYEGQQDFTTVEPVNLSVGGMLIYDRTMVAAPDEFSPVEILLKFDDGQKYAIAGRVRRTALHANRDRGLDVGLQFDRLPPSEEMSIGNIVMRWQREIRRRIVGERQ